MKRNKDIKALYNTLILAGMLLLISYHGFGQQALEISFEPASRHEIVITRMPARSTYFFGKEFVFTNEKEVGFENWMVDESSWLKKKNVSLMDFEFVHAERELALEAWMIQTFKLEDRIQEGDIAVEKWMLADTEWFEMN